MTEGERKLWALLRRKRLSGFRFRRQQPIGPYIADFFCPSAKLVIEIDGGGHAHEVQTGHDALRTRWLEANGYRVLRFWNLDVFKNQTGVLGAAYFALTHPPFRPFGPPSPSRGEAILMKNPRPPSPLEGEGVEPKARRKGGIAT